ncbi:hypothetical protein FQZ97_1084720 [compost metagenome]
MYAPDGLGPQALQQQRRHRAAGTVAATEDQHIVLVAQGVVGRHLHAIAGAHRGPVQGQGAPAIELDAGQLVGQAQRLQGAGQGDQGEALQQ